VLVILTEGKDLGELREGRVLCDAITRG